MVRNCESVPENVLKEFFEPKVTKFFAFQPPKCEENQTYKIRIQKPPGELKQKYLFPFPQMNEESVFGELKN